MNNENDRKSFEVWAEPRGFMIESYQGSTGEWFFSDDDAQLNFECWTAALDAQRLRADTAEAELNALRLVFENSEDCELNDDELKLAAAEQRIASHERMLRFFANLADVRQVGTAAMDYVAALNPNPEGHYSDCATNNRSVPELLGPCDCGYEGKQK